MIKKFLYSGIIIILLSAISSSTYAHRINQSYLYLRVYENALSGRFEIAINDVNKALGLNYSIDDVTLGDINDNLERIQAYYLGRTKFSSLSGQHEVKFEKPSLLRVGGQLGTFLLLNFDIPDIRKIPELLEVNYNVMFDQDKDHVGMLIIEYSWKAGIMNNESLPSVTFSKDNTFGKVNLHEGSLFTGFINMVKEGVWHIWIGIDHILFLFALILPSVIIRNKSINPKRNLAFSVAAPQLLLNPANIYWTPVEKFKPAFIYILKIVTFFTISHTITLGLAAFEVIVLPSRLIESVIAISIALAAYHNIQPIFKSREWIIAFVFGFFHGFGFASVLSELRSGEYLGLTIFGFNFGVELGQIVIIIIIFPLLFAIRKRKSYNYLLTYGSVLLIFISLYWFIERAFEYDLPLGRVLFGIYNNLFG